MNFFKNRHPASYRDPAGFVFEEDGVLYRQVNLNYKDHYDRLISSGLYHHLTQEGLLIKHEEVEKTKTTDSYKFLKPERLYLICPPDWWTYDMLKDAALLTLRIQKICLQYGMTLKDAHPSNIQFVGTTPIFIDTLSFEYRDENEPWTAYRQFCETFLLPLVIGHYTGPESTKLLAAWPRGIPLKVGMSLLPFRARFNFHWALHIFLNGQVASKRKEEENKTRQLTNKSINSLIKSLKIAIRKCTSKNQNNKWVNYSKEARERGGYSASKLQVLFRWKSQVGTPSSILDLGSNTGEYSHILASNETQITQIESDANTCNEAYRNNKNNHNIKANSIRLDFEELMTNDKITRLRQSISSELVLCLGLLHHLAYKSNIPINDIFEILSQLTRSYLIIEFIPHDDEIIDCYFNKLLIETRKIELKDFESEISKYFNIIEKEKLSDSIRQLYLCKRI